MKPRDKRIAIAAILVLLAGAGLWWWNHAAVVHAISSGEPAATPPGEVQVAMSHMLNPSPAGMSASEAPDQCGKAIRDALNTRATELGQRDDASSQLAYALAVPYETSADSQGNDPVAMKRTFEQRLANQQRAFIHASEMAPDRPDLLFLAAASCWNGDLCAGVQKAVLEAQPDNLAVWLLEMGRASMRNDPEASERAFERAAQATRNDSYSDSVLQVLVDAYGGMAMPLECTSDAAKAALRRKTGMAQDFSMLDQALVLAGASRAAMSPAYNGIRLRCKPQPDVAMTTATRANCLKVMTRMAEGNSWIGRLIAVDDMVQLEADEPSGSAWRERYRREQWLLAQRAEPDILRRMKLEDYVLDESSATQAAREALGRWPPPADWLPEDERSRSLIQTGRPPPPKTR
jgi:hypothetical protein